MMYPVGFGVLVKPDPVEEEWKKAKDSKIIIPDKVKDAQRIHIFTGTILAIGEQAWRDLVDGKPWAKVGDRVIYARYAAKIFTHPETKEDVALVQDRDILLVLEEGENV
jgi:co-chaperonin GroES (HSP10)